MEYAHQGPITSWALEDRPREKLLQRGLGALTDAELIAILLRSGTPELSAIALARQMLETWGTLPQIAQASITELMQVKGIGEAKAMSLVAAFELGRRKGAADHARLKITSSAMAASYLSSKLGDLPHEVFMVLFLNQKNEIKAEKQMFHGGVSSTTVDPKMVFKEAMLQLASSIIVSHNHPSGNPKPSAADIRITRKLVAGAAVCDIRMLDHIIVSSSSYYSFADEGLLNPTEEAK